MWIRNELWKHSIYHIFPQSQFLVYRGSLDKSLKIWKEIMAAPPCKHNFKTNPNGVRVSRGEFRM